MSYQRKQAELQKLKRVYNQMGNRYGRGVYFDPDKNRYIKYSDTSQTKYWKRQTNKRFRKDMKISSGSNYKRCLDYWNIMF